MGISVGTIVGIASIIVFAAILYKCLSRPVNPISVTPVTVPAVGPAVEPAVGPAVGPAIEPAVGPAIEPAVGPVARGPAESSEVGDSVENEHSVREEED